VRRATLAATRAHTWLGFPASHWCGSEKLYQCTSKASLLEKLR
jgi:hypothetical protein